MKTYSFPYDYKSVDVSIDERFVQGVLVSNAAAYRAEKSPAELVEDALDHPINSPSLEELVAGKRKMVIITSDHTRPKRPMLEIPSYPLRNGYRDLQREYQVLPRIVSTILGYYLEMVSR